MSMQATRGPWWGQGRKARCRDKAAFSVEPTRTEEPAGLIVVGGEGCVSGLGRGLFYHIQHKVNTHNLMDGRRSP